MKKAGRLAAFPLCLAILFTQAGCGLRIDTPEADIPTLSFARSALLNASLCTHWIIQPENSGELNIPADFYKKAADAFGAPNANWFRSKNGQTAPPPPDALVNPKKSTEVLSLSQRCGLQMATDAINLATFTNSSSDLNSELSDSSFTDGFNQKDLGKLASMLFSTGMSLRFFTEKAAQNHQITLSEISVAGPRELKYVGKKWTTVKIDYPTKMDDLPGRQQQLSQIVEQLDATRFNLEFILANRKNPQVAAIVSNELVPHLQLQLGAAVKQAQKDLRKVGYPLSQNVKANKAGAATELLHTLWNNQLVLLRNSPLPHQLYLQEVGIDILNAESALGIAIAPMPGVEL